MNEQQTIAAPDTKYSPLIKISEGLMRDRTILIDDLTHSNRQWRGYEDMKARADKEIAALDVRIDAITLALLEQPTS